MNRVLQIFRVLEGNEIDIKLSEQNIWFILQAALSCKPHRAKKCNVSIRFELNKCFWNFVAVWISFRIRKKLDEYGGILALFVQKGPKKIAGFKSRVGDLK